MEDLPPDFKAFLKLLTKRNVRFLIVGGYTVAHQGFPRYTQNNHVWVAIDELNAQRVVEVIREFGFDTPQLNKSLFTTAGRITRMGKEPVNIEVMTSISGASFEICYPNRVNLEIDGIQVPFIGLADLRANKTASGRPKDLGDLDNLPDA